MAKFEIGDSGDVSLDGELLPYSYIPEGNKSLDLRVCKRTAKTFGAVRMEFPDITIPHLEEVIARSITIAGYRKARRHARRIELSKNRFAPLARWVRRNVEKSEEGVLGPDAVEAIQRLERYHPALYRLTDRMVDHVLRSVIKKEFKRTGAE